MISLKIDKEKAIEMEGMRIFVNFILWTFILWIAGSLFLSFFIDQQFMGFNWNFHWGFCLFIISVQGLYRIIIFWATTKQINSLRQEYSKDELMTFYEVIVKTKQSARLQVVNNVKISQNILERIYGFFNVEIDYGFGDNGYTHIFNYLTEEQAEQVQKVVRPHSRLAVNLGGRK